MSAQSLTEDFLQDADMEVVEGRCQATVRYTIRNFSKRATNKASTRSPNFYVNNLPWRILIDKRSKIFAFHLCCSLPTDDTTWSCSCRIEYYRILPASSGANPLHFNLKRNVTIDFQKPNHFIQGPTTYDFLLDSKNGYIKDDAITLEVYISVTDPVNIPEDEKARKRNEETNELIQAISLEDVDKCIAALEKKQFNNLEDFSGRSPLMWAAYKGNLKIVQLLVEANCKIDTVDVFGYTPLMRAVQFGHTEVARYLLEIGANVNFAFEACPKCESGHKFTALHFAVHHLKCPEDKFKFLINEGADLSSIEKWTAVGLVRNGVRSHVDSSTLMWAIKSSEFELTKMLIQTEEHINVTDADGRSPLMEAVHSGNLEIVKLLLEKGANPSKRDKTGQSPFSQSILLDPYRSTSDPRWRNTNERAHTYLSNLQMVRCLIEHGARFLVHTALHTAMKNRDIVQILLENKADANLIGENGDTPLTNSIKLNDLPLVKLLIAHGADVNLKDANGRLPIFEAINVNSLKIIESLLEKGSKLNVLDDKGSTPLLRCIMQENQHAIELLVKNGANVNMSDVNGCLPIFQAINLNDLTTVECLLENFTNINIFYNDGSTPLLQSVKKGDLNILKALVKKGADVNMSDKKGTSPLMECLNRQNSIFFKFLLDNGADLSFDNEEKEEILSAVIKTDNLTCLMYLMEAGVDFSAFQQIDKLAEENFGFAAYRKELGKRKALPLAENGIKKPRTTD